MCHHVSISLVAVVSCILWNCIACMSPELKQEILDRHNYYRSEVARGKVASQPSGADIVLLDWDDNAAKRVAAWTDECKYGHDSPKNRLFSNATTVGQNLAYHSWASADVPERVDLWYQEVAQYTYQGMVMSGPVVGHYTQLIWAKSALVGCAKTDCTGRSKWELTFGCNYAQAGNFMRQYPYLKGEPCSKCPVNYPMCHQGLCATEDQCSKLPEGSCTDSKNDGPWLRRAVNKNEDNLIARVVPISKKSKKPVEIKMTVEEIEDI